MRTDPESHIRSKARARDSQGRAAQTFPPNNVPVPTRMPAVGPETRSGASDGRVRSSFGPERAVRATRRSAQKRYSRPTVTGHEPERRLAVANSRAGSIA